MHLPVLAVLAGGAAASQAVRRRGSRRSSCISRAGTVRDELRPKVVVVGGGFGGLYATLRLAEMPWAKLTRSPAPKITLVDPKDRFVFVPLLTDFVLDQVLLDEVAPRFSELLPQTSGSVDSGRGTPIIEHIQSQALGADYRRRWVATKGSGAEDQRLAFDAVIMAPGALASSSSGPTLPGLREAKAAGRAVGFSTLADAEAVKARLTSSTPPSSIAVVGAGYVGAEVAAMVAEVLPEAANSGRIALFGTELLKGSEEANRQRSVARLQSLGVVRCEGRVKSFDSSGLEWAPRDPSKGVQRFDCDLVLLTGALAAEEQAQGLSAPPSSTAASGQAVVDEFLRASPGIFCIGDCAATKAKPTAQSAIAQADIAAWNVYAQLSGLPRTAWRRYQPAALGEFVALGRAEAAAVVLPGQLAKLVPLALPPLVGAATAPFVAADASGLGQVDLGGQQAALLRRLTYLYRMPTLSHRIRVAQQWAQRARLGAPLPANGPVN